MLEYGRRPHLRVAPDTCIASGECARIAPEVFDQQNADGTVTLRGYDPDPSLDRRIRRAVAACPSRAIGFTEEEQEAGE